ncbi:9462_t:CDS:2 [Diversispora eburnea]|uniref:9462_t:CDS:1 n=1 Tax=Diversispora eburnea TaxID=1213867 RepID=A0A9N9C4C4_9GLOM|nr:9462_t:CDS:2 [Diversispora eburnea]
MSLYTSNANTSFSSFIAVNENIPSTDAVPKRMSDCIYYRNLWWEKGEFNEKARWDEVTLPYVLATGIIIEDYEERAEKFNIHGCWEWSNGAVIIYELPSMQHEVCIGAIVKEIIKRCSDADGTNAEIYSLGATRTRDRNRGKEADESFRPIKPAVTAPNGCDGNDRPWPNLVVEVAYTETLDHAEEALKYWLSPGRAHDCIIVKIDPVPQSQVPVRMKAWHYCVSAGRGTRNTVPLVTTFEFGTQDGTGAPLNILQGQCVINISLRCLYHDLKPPAQIPQNLNDPVQLDFYFVQRAITQTFNIH